MGQVPGGTHAAVILSKAKDLCSFIGSNRA